MSDLSLPRDVLDLVDPDLRPYAAQIQPMLQQFLPMSYERLKDWRTLMEANAPPPMPQIAFERRTIPRVSEDGFVAVYLINAAPDRSRPGILHTHGGGFYAGSARGSLREMQKIADLLDCTVVSVDYRLAPEATYSASIEDTYSALCWMHESAASLGLDPERIAVMGESAGGGHAVLLCAAARERGGPSILFQALSYPMLDDRTGQARATPAHIGRVGWNEEMNSFGWRCFLGQPPGGAAVTPAAVPARISHLAGMPPAFIGVGALDLFVEEDIAFANRLIQAGVPTELLVVPGAFHAFDTVAAEAAVSRRFTAAKAAALRRAFATIDERTGDTGPSSPRRKASA
ncbi:alpha/beta hydrolase [Novosphingobium malaysiense]|uniref:alpha/beta hydrolase n=1 Tax=Novosphingobium malaysiense TaxID=1348853 RepID=UPI0009DF97D7|nr:alpha/beta hydrolase [Novosphingobium malaysiense]